MYINNTEQIYKDDFMFREEIPSGKRKESVIEKRIVCQEPKCNRYELITENCVYIHKKFYHGNQQYKENCRPIKHKCNVEKKERK